MKTKLLRTISFLALLSILQSVNAQTWSWVKWSDGTQTTVRSVSTDANGNLYSTGTFHTTTKFEATTLTASSNAAFVAKYNSSGVLGWAKSINNSGFLAADSKSLAADVAGNVYVTGAYSGTIEVGTKTLTGGSHYMAKFDTDGNFKWVINTASSNTVATNGSFIYVAGGNNIQKFNTSGVEAWIITGAKSNQGYMNFFSMAINKAGNLILAGDIDDKWNFGGTLITGGYQNIVLLEMSSDGNTNWAKTFGSSTNGADHVQHITLDGANNIIMTGAVGGATMFDAVSIAAKNGYLVKLNSKGVAKWGTALTNTTTLYGSGGINVAADSKGAVFVTGGFGAGDLKDGGSVTYVKTMSGLNAFILKFDSSGVFKSALTNKEGLSINSRGMALASTSAGMYFAGVCSPQSEWGTLKVTGYGSVFSKIDDGGSPGDIKAKGFNSVISVFPNPSEGIFTINTAGEFNSPNDAIVCVMNTLGEIVYQAKFDDQFKKVDLSGYPSGIYYLQLFSSNGVTGEKLLIE